MAWCRFQDGVLVLQLQIQPGSKADSIVGIQANRLKIRIQAAPVDGRANARLINLLAGEFGVPKSAVQIVRGQTGKAKTLVIANPKSWPAWYRELSR